MLGGDRARAAAAGLLPDLVVVLWVLAFASATQDICVDGIYITSLDAKRQAAWIGVQGMSGTSAGSSRPPLVVVRRRDAQGQAAPSRRGVDAGRSRSARATMAALALYHWLVLPTGSIDRRPKDAARWSTTFVDSVRAFFRKKSIWGMLRSCSCTAAGEGFLLVEAPLFLQAPLGRWGVGLSLEQKA